MEPTPARVKTAIPPRFASQRDRVLRILARWEQATIGAGLRLSASERALYLRSR